jgi:hypothetical protein
MRLLVVTPGEAAVISASFEVSSGSTLALPPCLGPQPMPLSLLVTPAAPACSLWPTPAGATDTQGSSVWVTPRCEQHNRELKTATKRG